MPIFNRRIASSCFTLIFATFCGAQEITASVSKPNGIYNLKESIVFHVAIKGEHAADVSEVTYSLKKGGFTVLKAGVLKITDSAAEVDTSLDEPGAVLGEFKIKVGGKDFKALAGAGVAMASIGRSAPKPDDFDTFWKDKITAVHAIPMNANAEAADAGKPGVNYFKISLDNINGTHVIGQLAKPSKEGKYPALLLVQYAGVYGLPKANVVNRAANGWLALNIMAHDLPFDQPDAFYKDIASTKLKDYITIGNDDREKSYFLRMYLGCYRAVDYLTSRPDWDGRTMVVMGTSQGGQQSIITAGLHPRITAMIANVPAGCDVTANAAGRAFGFPYWGNYANWNKNPKILETGRYFDAMNFAPKVECPSLVSMGLIDETCPPAGVHATVNCFAGPREALVLPLSNHHGDHNAQAAFYKRSEEWLRALVKGEAPPIEP